jgi:GntR family transcriptional repressor for pyruvate dehydrogenase complex
VPKPVADTQVLPAQSPDSLQSPNLVQLVIRRIQERIESGDLRPGEILPSGQSLVDSYGVSRSVIREALAALEALGVIEVRHGKGAYVTRAPYGILLGMLDLFNHKRDAAMRGWVWEVRMICETEVARLSARRRQHEDLDKMAAALEALRREMDDGGLGLEPDEIFHLTLAEATHNPVLVRMMLSIASIVRPIRAEAWQSPVRRASAFSEHAAIFTAICNGDDEAACQAMAGHLNSIRQLDENEARCADNGWPRANQPAEEIQEGGDTP